MYILERQSVAAAADNNTTKNDDDDDDNIQEWFDYKLAWNETEYGGVSCITVPATYIWTPDVVLFNRLFLADPFGHCHTLCYPVYTGWRKKRGHHLIANIHIVQIDLSITQ